MLQKIWFLKNRKIRGNFNISETVVFKSKFHFTNADLEKKPAKHLHIGYVITTKMCYKFINIFVLSNIWRL